MRQTDLLDKWLFDSFQLNPEQLALVRIAYAAFNLLFLFGFNFHWVASLPPEFYAPPAGLPRLLFELRHEQLLNLVQCLLVLFNCLLLFGRWSRTASVGVGLCLMWLFGSVFTLGNIYHVILWIIFPLLMSMSGWGNAISMDGPIHPRRSWPILLMAVFIGFAFFTAGQAKLFGGWLGTETSATWQYFFKTYFHVGRDKYLAERLLSVDNRFLWEFLDWAVVLFELGFLPAVLGPALFRFWCYLAVLFHIGVLLALGISFSIHLPIFLLFIDWRTDGLSNRVIEGIVRTTSAMRRADAWWLIGFGLYCLLLFLFPINFSVDGAFWFECLLFAFAAGIGTYYYIVSGLEWIRSK